jgi:hypothetical protein
MKSSDGKAINMPGFASSTGGSFLMNFAAGPAKPSWTGPVLVFTNASIGSHTLDVFAQDNSQAFYRSTITITVVEPTMNISAQYLGYDAATDGLEYRISINRLYGFSESVVAVGGYGSEPSLGCVYDIVNADTIHLNCGHDAGDRPTSGTLMISVSTPSMTRQTSIGYVLPPL